MTHATTKTTAGSAAGTAKAQTTDANTIASLCARIATCESHRDWQEAKLSATEDALEQMREVLEDAQAHLARLGWSNSGGRDLCDRINAALRGVR